MSAGALMAVIASALAAVMSAAALLVKFARFVGMETRLKTVETEQKRSARSTGERLERITNDIARLEERTGYKRRLSQVGAPVEVIRDHDSSEDGDE